MTSTCMGNEIIHNQSHHRRECRMRANTTEKSNGSGDQVKQKSLGPIQETNCPSPGPIARS